jgi:hypothetical protein
VVETLEVADVKSENVPVVGQEGTGLEVGTREVAGWGAQKAQALQAEGEK